MVSAAAKRIARKKLAEDIAAFEQKSQLKAYEWAVLGWHFAIGIEASYVPSTPLTPPPPRLPARPRLSLERATVPCWPASDPPMAYVRRLHGIPSIHERWKALAELVDAPIDALRKDDFADVPDAELPEALRASLSGGELGIVILGAGPAGLGLANAIRLKTGGRVRILVLESRVERPHFKLPYSRHWLADLDAGYLMDQLCPETHRLLLGLGRDQSLGAKISMLESMLLLSARHGGVKFGFIEDYDLGFIEGSDADLVIDATGGRFDPTKHGLDAFAEADPENRGQLTLQGQECYGRERACYGVTQSVTLPTMSVDMEPAGRWHIPHLGGMRFQVPMIKTSGIPREAHDILLAYVKSCNRDGIFYLWDAPFHDTIGESLLFTNLSAPAYAELGQRVRRPMPLSEFLAKGFAGGQSVDPRMGMALRMLKSYEASGSRIVLEPPYLYSPRVRAIGLPFDRALGRPVIPVGDSVYPGHPKVGNGLGVHLYSTRLLASAIAKLVVGSAHSPSLLTRAQVSRT